MPLDGTVREAPAALSAELFRDAMSRLGAPVTVVTTDGVAGRHGLTVSAITSVSDTPPTVLVCLNRNNRSHEAFLKNGKIGINILGHNHHEVAGIFASSRRTADEKFAAGAWHVSPTGVPLLDEAVVTLEGVIEQAHSVATHDVLFCKIVSITLNTQAKSGLVWCGRAFHTIPLTVSIAE